MYNINILKKYYSRNIRSAKLYLNIISSFALKGWSALVVLIMVPLTLQCLGTYQNGVWLTVSSLLIWVDQMDIGLGNGLRNSLAINIAHGEIDKARQVVSSTIAMLCFIVLPILLVFTSLLWFTNIYDFLNVDARILPDLRIALTWAVTFVGLTFVMKFISNVYMGMQLPAVSNLILALGQTIALLSTWGLFLCNKASFFYIILANTASPLLVYIVAYPYTFYVKYPYLRPHIKDIQFNTALKLCNLGLKFFWLQIAALIQFFSANILISKLFTPELVTPYQVSYRYMSLMMVAFTVVCMPFWNATTDAFERGDMDWIKSANRKMNIFTILIFVAMAFMVIVSPWVYDLWINNKCEVSIKMTIVMAVYIYLLIMSMRYSYFLNGIGALRLQMYMTVSAIIFIPAVCFVSNLTHSIIWFMIVMCLCNIPGILVNYIQFNKILKGKAVGLWRI